MKALSRLEAAAIAARRVVAARVMEMRILVAEVRRYTRGIGRSLIESKNKRRECVGFGVNKQKEKRESKGTGAGWQR